MILLGFEFHLTVCLSDCPSVHLSVTLRYYVEAAKSIVEWQQNAQTLWRPSFDVYTSIARSNGTAEPCRAQYWHGNSVRLSITSWHSIETAKLKFFHNLVQQQHSVFVQSYNR